MRIVSSGKLTLYCDNNGAINNVFHRPLSGINSFLQSDYDLIQVAKNLCQIIPIDITATWVKGHSQAIQKTVQEEINIQADRLAGSYAEQPDPSFLPNSYQIPPSHFKVCLIHHSKVITAKLYRTLQHLFHSDPLRLHIMKKNNLSAQVMDLINWDAFSTSFNRLTRNRKIKTAKLVHHLINTNVQNHKYYGSSSLCPCCQEQDETFAHVLQCKSPSALSHRSQATEQLRNNLLKIHTPVPIIDALLHGIQKWTTEVPSNQVRSLTIGSLKAGDVVLTSAFTEQFHTIGWLQLLLGRLSNKWELAYTHYKGISSHQSYKTNWSTSFIPHIWEYTHSLWQHRNGILHGLSFKQCAEKILTKLRMEVSCLYESILENPDKLLPRHLGLIKDNSLERLLNLPYDDIQCWLRSVREAQEVLKHQQEQLRQSAALHFSPSSSTYSPSTDFSDYSTILTETTISDTISDLSHISASQDSDEELTVHSIQSSSLASFLHSDSATTISSKNSIESDMPNSSAQAITSRSPISDVLWPI